MRILIPLAFVVGVALGYLGAYWYHRKRSAGEPLRAQILAEAMQAQALYETDKPKFYDRALRIEAVHQRVQREYHLRKLPEPPGVLVELERMIH